MSVRVERAGPVTTVILDRPEARNAVDRPTADALAGAFAAFEADDDALAAVLWGAGGTFCAGADLKAFAGRDVAGSSSRCGATCASSRRTPSWASSAGAGACP
jgi:enoyl-CoA hydratase/carnithine racemase